jgi:exodeoxyribonuclease-3
MRIYSYNVNGIRSALNKGLLNWIEYANADVLCLQELKAQASQVDIASFESLGYKVYLHTAEKKGYSGVAILSRVEPVHVEYGCGNPMYDLEGRILRMDLKDFSIMSVYIPSGSSGDDRQAFKMKFLDFFYDYIDSLIKEIPKLIISGDFNICHKPIDIHNPVSNKNSSGFLPEEREWVTKFLDLGFTDTFRFFSSEPHNYTWWSFRANARAKNLGWRIDYHMTTKVLENNLTGALIFPDAIHSDHCPILLEIE